VERARREADSQGLSADDQVQFTSFLFTHNIQVAFTAFALGMTAGIGTAIALFFNGVFLGALAQRYAENDLAGWFWAWILPHGIPEMTAICVAGAAGLIVARALVAPRGLRRREALRVESRRALELLLGTLCLFVIAGVIEGTVSQIHPPRLPVTFKISFALIVGAAVYGYLLSGLKNRSPAEST
jgi:uncharacterized membrane protein SpoIIM required for sporulation